MKQVVLAAVILVVLLAVAIAGYRRLFRSDEVQNLSVVELEGQARVASDEAGERAILAGDRVAAGDRIKTEEGGRVVLSLMPEDRIELGGNSELLVKSLDAERSVLQINYGQVQASLNRYRDRTVQFEAKGNPVTVQTQEGSFKMTHDGWGTYDVVPLSGEVNLVDGDKVTPLGEGQRVVVAPQGEVRTEDAAARSLLLKVDWPEASAPGAAVEVKGQTEGGSAVTIGGDRVPVAPDGSFTARLPVPESGSLVVKARSSVGEATARSDNLLRAPTPTPRPPTPPPKVDTKVPRLTVTHTGEWK